MTKLCNISLTTVSLKTLLILPNETCKHTRTPQSHYWERAYHNLSVIDGVTVTLPVDEQGLAYILNRQWNQTMKTLNVKVIVCRHGIAMNSRDA